MQSLPILLLVLFGYVGGVAAQGMGANRIIKYEMRPVQTFGELQTNTAPGLTPKEVRAGGPVLADISGLALDDVHHLYVLDSDYHKIAVFDSTGQIKKVILGGFGEGPGEFTNASSLARGPDGSLYVLDSNQRISVFSKQGAFIGTFVPRGGRAKTIVLTNSGEIWLGLFFNSGQYAALQTDTTGRTLRYAFRVNDRDKLFSEYGESGRINNSPSGVIFASGAPGTWISRQGDREVRLGFEAYPSNRPYMDQASGGPIHMVTAGTRNVFALGRDRIAVVYYRLMNDMKTLRTFIDVFRVSGEYLGSALVPIEGKTRASLATPDGTHIYVAMSLPFPRVVKYRLIGQ